MAIQAGQNIKNALNENVKIFTVVKGIIVSYLITVPIFIVFAFILTYTDFPEKFISSAVLVTTMISILVAGSTATKNVKNRGWLNGSIVGAIYMGVLYIAGSLVFRDFSVDSHVIVMFVIGIVTGAIGGIVGINLKKKPNSKFR